MFGIVSNNDIVQAFRKISTFDTNISMKYEVRLMHGYTEPLYLLYQTDSKIAKTNWLNQDQIYALLNKLWLDNYKKNLPPLT